MQIVSSDLLSTPWLILLFQQWTSTYKTIWGANILASFIKQKCIASFLTLNIGIVLSIISKTFLGIYLTDCFKNNITKHSWILLCIRLISISIMHTNEFPPKCLFFGIYTCGLSLIFLKFFSIFRLI